MKSVKKCDVSGKREIISLDRAVAEILFNNYNPNCTEENRREVVLQLSEGCILDTDKYRYKEINPVKDLIDNIDDNIDLNEEN